MDGFLSAVKEFDIEDYIICDAYDLVVNDKLKEIESNSVKPDCFFYHGIFHSNDGACFYYQELYKFAFMNDRKDSEALFKDLGYMAVYSQYETGTIAFDLLLRLSTAETVTPITLYPEYSISIPEK
jgi:hypothetical protein